MQPNVIPLSRRLALLSPEQRAKAIGHLQACAESMQAADEQFAYASFFARGQYAATVLLSPCDARKLAQLDVECLDYHYPDSGEDWAFAIYANLYSVTEPADVYRDDLEDFGEKFFGKQYPEADEARAFLDGVADVVDRL